jgi:hypothetical protein
MKSTRMKERNGEKSISVEERSTKSSRKIQKATEKYTKLSKNT